MSHVISLQYTERLLRQAVFAFWRRVVGIRFFVALGLLLVSLTFQLARGDRSWFVGVLGAILLFGLGLAVVMYFVHLRNAMDKLRGMGQPTATLALDDASFSVSSGLGSATLQWSAVIEIWRFPSFWLLLLSKAQFITVPLTTVSPEAQAFILSRVSAAGGKVVD